MAIEVRYQMLSAPRETLDGSGIIKHDIQAVYSEDGESWVPVPNHHKEICVPSDSLLVVMDMPQGNAAQRDAKVQAYKDLLVENRFTQPVPYVRPRTSDWSMSGIEAYLELYTEALEDISAINYAVEVATAEAISFITVILNQSFPIMFSL